MSDLTNVVNQLLKGKSVESNLPVYIKGLSALYRRISMLRFAMNDYMFTEDYLEWSKDYKDGFGDLVKRLEDLIEKALLTENADSCEEDIIALREDCIRDMEELTALVDRLQLVQYKCNRAEFKFKESAYSLDYYKHDFEQDIIQYVVSDPDQQTVQMKITQVMSELPMRMSTNKFLDRIHQAYTLYSDSDVQSVDDFTYRIRCSAGLLVKETASANLSDIATQVEALSNVDFGKLETPEEFEQASTLLEETCSRLVSLSDSYVLFVDLLNDLLSIEMTDSQLQDAKETEQLMQVIKTLHAIYEGKADLTDDLADIFAEFEGVQENVMRQIFVPESAIEEIQKCIGSQLDTLNYTKDFERLIQISRLQSASTFASLNVDEEKQGIAGEIYCRKASDTLIEELDAYMHTVNIATKRAIMAAVSVNLPQVFHDINEFTDYVHTTLGQCSDEKEQYATMNLIHMMMDEEE